MASILQTLQGVLQQVEDLLFVELLERLQQVIDNLGVSFDRELDRVAAAFDEMLAAIPLTVGESASTEVSL